MLKSVTFRLSFASLWAAALWGILIYKAMYVPVTHDEVPGPTHYCNFSVWDIMMFPDNSPNNHILNTLLTKLAMFLFGNAQVVVRLPNILSFGLYFYAAYQICAVLFKKDNLLFFGGLALFLCNPYLLDFFSLCRGYGISNALLLTSVLFSLKAYLYQKEQAIWLSLVFAVLASYANFTLLVCWCAVNMTSFLFFVNQYVLNKKFLKLIRKTGLLLVGVLAYGALIYTPIHKMQSTDQFAPWQSNGFFKDTIVNLIENTLYGSKMIDIPAKYLALLVVLSFSLSGAILFFQWGKQGWEKVHKTPLFVAFALLGLTTLVNILQTVILDTPNLTGRTALLFLPLFSFLLVSMLFYLAGFSIWSARIISSVIIIFGILHLFRTVTLDRVREWWYDVNTFQVINTIKKDAQLKEMPVQLRTYWVFYPSFDFYTLTGKAPFLDIGDYSKDIDTTNHYDYYYIFDSEYHLLKNNYDILEKYDGGGRLLLKHK